MQFGAAPGCGKQLGLSQNLPASSPRACDATLAGHTWVLISESPAKKSGITGDAGTGAEIAGAARRDLAGNSAVPANWGQRIARACCPQEPR